MYLNALSQFSEKKAAVKAFGIFATVRKGRVLEPQREYLDSAKKDILSIADHTIQTYEWPGTGDTVVLVHGWESNTFRWRNLVAKLKEENINVIAFDAPGHGNSSGNRLHVPLYAKVLQHIIERHRPKYIVGHSVGGMAILYQEYLKSSPSVEKIVTVASPSELIEILNHFQQLLSFNSTVMQALKSYIFNTLGFHIDTFSSSAFVRTNSKKGLLFHDKLDTVTPYHASQKVHANWKDSRLVSTEGLGHSMHQDEVNDAIVRFFSR
ncbi:MAG: alpha/beta hydrolase [Pricia sp.]